MNNVTNTAANPYRNLNDGAEERLGDILGYAGYGEDDRTIIRNDLAFAGRFGGNVAPLVTLGYATPDGTPTALFAGQVLGRLSTQGGCRGC